MKEMQLLQPKIEALRKDYKDNPQKLNKEIMEKFRPEMSKYYYDSSKYKTYLEQLGIKYPTLREDQMNK